MADQWYFAWGEEKFGPFSAAQLKELAGLGRLQPTDTVWKAGAEKGVLAARINHLFSDPKTKDIPAKATVPVFRSELQPTQSRSSSHPGAGAKLSPWLPLTSDEVTSGERPETIPDGLTLRVAPDDTNSASPVSPAPIKTSRQATAVSGAVIIGQDGESVRYRKKCSKCRHTSSSITTMPITNEVTRVSFFCPKCRKLRDVVIDGTEPYV
jgi:hypothetical protein